MQLLERLGYREQHGCYRHPARQAVFCGDLIDRGPQIPDVLHLVRTMVEQEAARTVMGNHEFNAIAWHTPRPDSSDQFFRSHTAHRQRQHQATLDQMTASEIADAVAWFRTLPVAVDLNGLRVVHACWDPAGISVIRDACDSTDPFGTAFLNRALTTHDDPLGQALDTVLKGPELRLPDGHTITDAEGRCRTHVRIRWFESPDGRSIGDYAFPKMPDLRHVPLPDRVPARPYPKTDPPLFVGHYWLRRSDIPLLRPNLACLDLSVAKNGFLCAYRFDGETVLSADRLVRVPARSRRLQAGSPVRSSHEQSIVHRDSRGPDA